MLADGYFLQGPGVAAACPKGEYKAPTSASCVKCAYGVTTADVASSSEAACSVLLPRFAPLLVVNGTIKATQLCPQSYLCPGGQATRAFDPSDPTNLDGTAMMRCADGTWTTEPGASYADECCECFV